MITWLWLIGTPVLLFAIGIGSLVRQLHRNRFTAPEPAALEGIPAQLVRMPIASVRKELLP